MNSTNFLGFLLPYGMPSIIIAVMVAICSLVLKKFLPQKFSAHLKSYIPFVMGILFYLVYDLIFVSKTFNFNEQTISAGVICGTLGTIIFAFIKNLKGGKIITDKTLLAIEGILENLLDAKIASILAQKFKEFFMKGLSQTELLSLIVPEIISATGNDDQSLANQTAWLIIDAVNSIKLGN